MCNLGGIVRKGRTIGFAMGAAAVAAAVVVAAATAAPAASRPDASTGATAPKVSIRPGVLHLGKVFSSPPTGQCAPGITCYVPAQMQRAYNLGPLLRRGITGKGRTIAIVDSFGSPTIKSDLAFFDKTFGLPAPPSLAVIAPVGRIPKWDPANSDMVGWAGETSLDVEWAHAMAPGANIVLIETPVSETEGVTGFPQIVKAEQLVISNPRAHGIAKPDVISQSFSATEETFTGIGQINAKGLRDSYKLAARHGVTVLTATGDSGAADVGLDLSTFFTKPVTSWPDSDPLVTGVGGTQVKLSSSGKFSQVAWNDTFTRAVQEFIFGDAGPNPLASGGGKSILFSRPTWQNGVKSVTGSARGVPDISMSGACSGLADVFESFPPGTGIPNGWFPSCGTSEATPLFAGVVALAAQVAGHSLGLINPALYRLSAQHAPGLVDVTSGSNIVSFTQGGKKFTFGFPARKGYDLVTGVGTVNAAFFAYELAGKRVP
jgi:subtilase family serine protease